MIAVRAVTRLDVCVATIRSSSGSGRQAEALERRFVVDRFRQRAKSNIMPLAGPGDSRRTTDNSIRAVSNGNGLSDTVTEEMIWPHWVTTTRASLVIIETRANLSR
jgi:hypothetical protein